MVLLEAMAAGCAILAVVSPQWRKWKGYLDYFVRRRRRSAAAAGGTVELRIEGGLPRRRPTGSWPLPVGPDRRSIRDFYLGSARRK